MTRQLDPSRLTLDNYPFHWTLDSAFGDMDVAGHINNIALTRYYETGRSRWFLNMAEDVNFFKNGLNTLVAEYTVRFLSEVNYPEQVIVATGIGRIGNSSFSCLQALFVNGTCVGLSDTAMVLAIHGKPTPIEGSFRENMHLNLIKNS